MIIFVFGLFCFLAILGMLFSNDPVFFVFKAFLWIGGLSFAGFILFCLWAANIALNH